MTGRKLLALCDSPVLNSGFARVASELLKVWHDAAYFDEIWVWGIGYRGFPHGLPYRMCPAAVDPKHPIWWQDVNLNRFLAQASRKQEGWVPYTHLWMMHDPHTLHPLHEALRRMRKAEDTPASYLYFPVDSVMRREWCKIIEAVDCPVAYTDFGRKECARVFRRSLMDGGMKAKPANAATRKFSDRIEVLPHGVDTNTFYPLSEERRNRAREERFGGLVKPGDLLVVNVNTHQYRKHLFQTLETFKRMLEQDGNAKRKKQWKLYMHMPKANPDEGTDLAQQAEALGIPLDRILFGDPYFTGQLPSQPAGVLNEIYNSADLILNTSGGEGWGLTITEAMAAGCLVAAPQHTAMLDYFGDEVGIPLPCSGYIVHVRDNNRPRPVVDAELAAAAILDVFDGKDEDRLARANAGRTLMSGSDYDWRELGNRWLELFDRA